MSPPSLTLCFDLDGTLVNTAPDLFNALDHSLEQFGHPKPDHTPIRPIIGQGAKAMQKKALAQFANTPPSSEELNEMWQTMIDHYAANIAEESHPYEGVIAVLKALKSAGHRTAICTNKPMFLTEPLLNTLNMTQHFDVITSADSYPFKKPDPRTLWETIKKAGGTPEHALMIGDSKTDIDTARNANIPVIGVTFGYTETPIDALAPDKIMSNYQELPELIEALFPAN